LKAQKKALTKFQNLRGKDFLNSIHLNSKASQFLRSQVEELKLILFTL